MFKFGKQNINCLIQKKQNKRLSFFFYTTSLKIPQKSISKVNNNLNTPLKNKIKANSVDSKVSNKVSTNASSVGSKVNSKISNKVGSKISNKVGSKISNKVGSKISNKVSSNHKVFNKTPISKTLRSKKSFPNKRFSNKRFSNKRFSKKRFFNKWRKRRRIFLISKRKRKFWFTKTNKQIRLFFKWRYKSQLTAFNFQLKILQSYFFYYVRLKKKALLLYFQKQKMSWFWLKTTRYLHLQYFLTYQIFFFLKKLLFWGFRRLYRQKLKYTRLIKFLKFCILKINNQIIFNPIYQIFLYDFVECSLQKFYYIYGVRKRYFKRYRFNFNYKKRRRPVIIEYKPLTFKSKKFLIWLLIIRRFLKKKRTFKKTNFRFFSAFLFFFYLRFHRYLRKKTTNIQKKKRQLLLSSTYALFFLKRFVFFQQVMFSKFRFRKIAPKLVRVYKTVSDKYLLERIRKKIKYPYCKKRGIWKKKRFPRIYKKARFFFFFLEKYKEFAQGVRLGQIAPHYFKQHRKVARVINRQRRFFSMYQKTLSSFLKTRGRRYYKSTLFFYIFSRKLLSLIPYGIKQKKRQFRKFLLFKLTKMQLQLLYFNWVNSRSEKKIKNY